MTQAQPEKQSHPGTPDCPPAWHAKDPALVPTEVQNALRRAMQLEDVAMSHFDDLLWIIAQESGGEVGVRNKCSTARGLFQLLRAQYFLNPNGEKSFGNATEECQGGIRYIIDRYQSTAEAKAFWLQHRWY
jgi:SLT domain-containing protein